MKRVVLSAVLAALTLTASGCAVANDFQSQMEAAPPAATLAPAPQTSAGTGAHTITFRATAHGKASANFGSERSETIMDGMPESWRHEQKTDDPNQNWSLSVMADDITKGTEVTCEIARDGQVLATQSGKGMVNCSTAA